MPGHLPEGTNRRRPGLPHDESTQRRLQENREAPVIDDRLYTKGFTSSQPAPDLGGISTPSSTHSSPTEPSPPSEDSYVEEGIPDALHISSNESAEHSDEQVDDLGNTITGLSTTTDEALIDLSHRLDISDASSSSSSSATRIGWPTEPNTLSEQSTPPSVHSLPLPRSALPRTLELPQQLTPQPNRDADPAPEPDSAPEPSPSSSPDLRPVSHSEPKPGADTESQPQPQPDSEPDSRPGSNPDPESSILGLPTYGPLPGAPRPNALLPHKPRRVLKSGPASKPDPDPQPPPEPASPTPGDASKSDTRQTDDEPEAEAPEQEDEPDQDASNGSDKSESDTTKVGDESEPDTPKEGDEPADKDQEQSK